MDRSWDIGVVGCVGRGGHFKECPMPDVSGSKKIMGPPRHLPQYFKVLQKRKSRARCLAKKKKGSPSLKHWEGALGTFWRKAPAALAGFKLSNFGILKSSNFKIQISKFELSNYGIRILKF